MRKIVWFIWKRKILFSLPTYVILVGILFFFYGHYTIPSNDPLKLFAKILEDLSQIVPTNYPFIYLVLSVILPFPIFLFGGWIIKYYLLPGDKNTLLNALLHRCSEVTELGCKQIERDFDKVSKWLNGLNTGCKITPEDCQILGREVIEITRAKILYATCLQTPQDMHDKLRGFSEIIAKEIRISGKELIRIIVCDPTIFDLSSKLLPDQEKIKWFVNLHKQSLTLRYIEQQQFLDLFQIFGVSGNKLDIMLFDKKVVYSLENDNKTLKVIMNNGSYILYLMDSPEDIRIYQKFMDGLRGKSIDVWDHINRNRWAQQY